MLVKMCTFAEIDQCFSCFCIINNRIAVCHCFQNVYTPSHISFAQFDFMHFSILFVSCCCFFQGVHREENCHSLHQLLLNRCWSSAWMFSCLQVSQPSSCSQAVSLHLSYAHISLPISIKFYHTVDVVIELCTWRNVVALPSHFDTGGNVVPCSCHRLESSRYKTLLEWKILVILFISNIYDKDFMSGGFRVEVSPLVLMLFHEKSGLHPSCISLLLSQ